MTSAEAKRLAEASSVHLDEDELEHARLFAQQNAEASYVGVLTNAIREKLFLTAWLAGYRAARGD